MSDPFKYVIDSQFGVGFSIIPLSEGSPLHSISTFSDSQRRVHAVRAPIPLVVSQSNHERPLQVCYRFTIWCWFFDDTPVRGFPFALHQHVLRFTATSSRGSDSYTARSEHNTPLIVHSAARPSTKLRVSGSGSYSARGEPVEPERWIALSSVVWSRCPLSVLSAGALGTFLRSTSSVSG